MAAFTNKLTLLLLCAFLAAAASQASQGRPHESQGGSHVSQGGTHESQGGAHESQGGAHESQGGAHESQGGAHENQGRVRRQAQDNEAPNWVSCDVTTDPIISCHDCTTRVHCKPIGGILIPCRSPVKPYCNKGICSAVPAEGC